MINIKLVLAYDGTRYRGWQKTRTGKSIEAELQSAIQQILQHPVSLQAASRTDAGVHAIGQIINFFSEKDDINPSQLMFGLNGLIPKDIRVLSSTKMPISFHPTLDCSSKEYRYYACQGSLQLPHHRFYSWHIYQPLDLDRIRKTIPLLIGTHNFASFCNFKSSVHYPDYVRNLEELELIELEENRLCFRMRGNHFLYRMARNLVGTLVDVGKGKIEIEEICDILKSQKRPAAGISAPAHGLFLHQVHYLSTHTSSLNLG
jgi:tRNA pseudouridine38-40 synthase